MTAFGDRMKRYESAGEQVLPSRIPVIIRLDGNSFSNLTNRNFEKPFDRRFEEAMNQAAISVMHYCSGSQIAYVQSDEITVLLRNDQTDHTDPFLANRTQKLSSLTAAKASVAFNKSLENETEAVFDSRVFVVPKSDVINNFLWRQLDAFKNCVSSTAYYGLKEKFGRKNAQRLLHGKSTDQRKEIIFKKLGVSVKDIPTHRKRGRCIFNETREVSLSESMDSEKLERLISKGHIDDPDKKVKRSFWKVDNEIPKFNEDRNYIGKYLS